MGNDTPQRSPDAGTMANSRETAGGSKDGPDAEEPDWTGNHAVDIRLSVPLLFWTFYVTIVGGPERRSRARRQLERAKHPMGKLGNVVMLSSSGIVLLLALSAVIMGASVFLIGQVFEIGLILR